MNIVTVTLTRDQAEVLVTRINDSLESARQDLLTLWQGRGWEALGYDTWETCVQERFVNRHRSYLYRMLAAARLESEAGLEVGVRPESHAREIISLLDDDDMRIIAMQLCVENNAQTAAECKAIAQQVWLLYETTDDSHEATIIARYREGELGPAVAYELIQLLRNTTGTAKVRAIVSMCSDVMLAQRVVVMHMNGYNDLIDEVFYSGAIPAFPDPVPIPQATVATLAAWLEIETSEVRARHVADNSTYYEQRNNLIGEIVNLSREAVRLFGTRNEELLARTLEQMRAKIEELDRGQRRNNTSSNGQI